jgi:hypothetical protein
VSTPSTFDEIDGPGQMRHETEIMTGREGSPSIEVQAATHGAPPPPEDRGVDEGPDKYSGGI